MPRAARVAARGATVFWETRFLGARSGKEFWIFFPVRNGGVARGCARRGISWSAPQKLYQALRNVLDLFTTRAIAGGRSGSITCGALTSVTIARRTANLKI